MMRVGQRLDRAGQTTRSGLRSSVTRQSGAAALSSDAEVDEHFELAVVAKRVPHAVIFGPSALMFHGVTTQLAHTVHLAIERGRWTPHLKWPSVKVVHLSSRSFTAGVEEHIVASDVPIRVYLMAKTVADLFKLRSRFGFDLVIEALKEGWRERLFTRPELEEYARR